MLPLIIAHRGASGYLPEHTLPAKALAFEQGADFLEQDVIATRDGVLIVCHDVYLDRITNVAEVFPDRARDDGRYYAIDFSWQEVRHLTVRCRPPRPRDPGEIGASIPAGQGDRICSLDEEVAFARALNAGGGRRVGLYPEIKAPAWHRQHGFDLTAALLSTLSDRRFDEFHGALFVQCFDAGELRRARFELGCEFPLVQLVGRHSNAELLDAEGLAGIAEYAVALAPNYRQLIEVSAGEPQAARLVQQARAAGLQLHPYTFNLEEFPPYARDLETLLGLSFEMLGPEAVFCDFPDIAVAARKAFADRSTRPRT
jgi:glycerophosphoryl diester phosphodiesterase